MAVITVTAKIVLSYDTEDGLIHNQEQAREDAIDYLSTYPSIGSYDITTEVEGEYDEDDEDPSEHDDCDPWMCSARGGDFD